MSAAEQAETPQRDDLRHVQEWWLTLADQNRAARARLRRATVREAACDEATLDLCHRMGLGWTDLPKVARLACVLAHVRTDEHRRFAQAIGRAGAETPDRPMVSPLRFRHLLTAVDDDDIVRGFRRAVAITGGCANVRNLAFLVMRWELDTVRTRFAFEYYTPDRPAEKGPAA